MFLFIVLSLTRHQYSSQLHLPIAYRSSLLYIIKNKIIVLKKGKRQQAMCLAVRLNYLHIGK